MSAGRARLLGLGLALCLAALGAIVRGRTALADKAFASAQPEGLLKSDPGLLVYLVQRIVESGGSMPSDFRADPRIEWPEGWNIPAHLPVAQEFVVAWAYELFGGDTPLHIFCLSAAGACASLAVVGVYLLALELSGSVLLALLSAALAAALPANYRTLGFVFMDEDFSLPFLVLHFALLARAFRVRTALSIALAAFAAGAAIATWHATSFLVTLEAACVLAWVLRTGRNPLAQRGAWIFPMTLVGFATLVPFLRTTLFVSSAPMLVVFALWIAAFVEGGRSFSPGRRAMLVLGTLGALALLSLLLARASNAGQREYGHVFELVGAKIRHLGELPADPNELSMDARIMWQSSFNTLDPIWGAGQLGFALLAIFPAAWVIAVSVCGWNDGRAPLRPPDDPPTVIASMLVLLSLPVAWLISRTIVLPGLLLPPLAGAFVALVPGTRLRVVTLALVVLVQTALCASYLHHYENPWYRPEQRQAEIAALVHAIPTLVPEGAAIACDSMNGTAILLHTRHPIAIQPKWESRESRARFEEFLTKFFHATPEEFRRLVRERFRCRYLLVDRFTLGYLSAYPAGMPRSQTQATPGTAADALLSLSDEKLRAVPGYRLLYRSPASIQLPGGAPSDFFRLFDLGP